MRFLYCLYPFFYWLKIGAYWSRTKSLYEAIRKILLTIRWMYLGLAIQKIVDGIYIGDIESQTRMQVRKENGIGALLNCAFEIRPKLREDELYYHLPLHDCEWIESTHIITGLYFIGKAREMRKKVLIACAGGASRSASLILAYMISEGWDMNDALRHMQKIRPVINPHPLCLQSIRTFFNIPPY